jgi:trans-aconitate methyltransferase
MSDMNSSEYWDERFATDWETLGGQTQSRIFMDLIVRHLPADVQDEILRRRLSILDAGCAEGDGTSLLAETFAGCEVAGFDFSPVAVGKARKNYPGLPFFVSRFENLKRRAGVIVSSNCLEHVPDAMETLRALARTAKRYLILLLPYLETYPLHTEHLRQIRADTFPEEFDRWQLTYRALGPPSPVWEGYQLLLVYETPRRRRRPELTPLPDAATVADRLRALASGS